MAQLDQNKPLNFPTAVNDGNDLDLVPAGIIFVQDQMVPWTSMRSPFRMSLRAGPMRGNI